MVRPSAFAAFRLTTSSNFVGCSTGRSAGLAPFRILSTKTAAAPPDLVDVRAIGDQPAGLDILPELVHGGEPAPGGQLRESPGLREEERGREHEESAGAGVSRRSEGPLDLARVSNLERQQLPPSRPGGGFGRLPVPEAQPIPEDRHRRRGRDELLEQLESLPGRLYRLKAQPREVPARVSEALDDPDAHRIAGGRHDDGDRRGRLLERGQPRPRGRSRPPGDGPARRPGWGSARALPSAARGSVTKCSPYT